MVGDEDEEGMDETERTNERSLGTIIYE